jgi:glycosidase
VFVRSFYDSDGDGIGDLNGLIQKLDYITSLGASCIWLMPVAASPSYHGYDVSDYYRVAPAYGTNDDFKRLVAEAHRRGIRVLVDMVLNHASSAHPSFQAALRDTMSPYRAWYRFSPTPLGKGPWGEEVWHRSPVREEYYYGVFWSGMPDLNYETPAVREEAKKVATFWLREMGVDGFRLDAVPYLVEEGTCLMGCPGTHVFLHEYAEHIHSVKPDAYTVGEAWGSITTMIPYYPDQLTSYFSFELADSLLSVVRTGSAAGLLAGFLRLQDTLPAFRWSPFLSNHDQTRVLTALGGDVARAKIAATLLLTLPGLPFIYYGEEIGMTGDKPDPRLRTPMQWSPRPGLGFTTGTPWEAPQPDSLTTNVAVEDADPSSLLNLYRRLIHLRKENEALATGTLVPLSASDAHVAAYLRRSGSHAVLVVANLGGAPAAGVTISSGQGVLAAGRYTPRTLLGGLNGAPPPPRVAGGRGRADPGLPSGHDWTARNLRGRPHSPLRRAGGLHYDCAVGWERERVAAQRCVRQQVARAIQVAAGHGGTYRVGSRVHEHERRAAQVGDHILGRGGMCLAQVAGGEC